MQAAPINPAAMMGMMTANNTTTKAGASGDFEAMLMQMFGGGQTTDATTLDGLLGGDSSMQYMQQLLAQQGEADELTEQEGTDNAMQMLAALFAATPADVSYVQSPMAYKDGGTQGVMSTAQQASNLQRLATLGMPTATTEQAAFTLNGETMTPEQLASFAQTATPEQLAQLVSGKPSTATNTAMNTATGTQTGGNQAATTAPKLGTAIGDATEVGTTVAKRELDPLMSAYNRLYGMQKPTEASSKPVETADIEAMQQAVDNGTYLNPSIAAIRDASSSTEQVTPRDIASQVQTGIIANLDRDQKEFVIKLRPEGLGNITVKMVENDGKISLSIITSTQQAQTALSGEISSLREALRPFNAEITQLVTNEMSYSQQQQQGMSERRHDGYQGEQQHRNGRFWEPEDTTTPEQLREYAQHVSSSLSAHI